MRHGSSSRPAGLGARLLNCPCLDLMQKGVFLAEVFKGPVAIGECVRDNRGYKAIVKDSDRDSIFLNLLGLQGPL